MSTSRCVVPPVSGESQRFAKLFEATLHNYFATPKFFLLVEILVRTRP
jgi:hypothetical protein